MNKLRLMSSMLVGKFSRASLTVIFPEVRIRKEAEIGLIPGRVGIGVMIRVCWSVLIVVRKISDI